MRVKNYVLIISVFCLFMLSGWHVFAAGKVSVPASQRLQPSDLVYKGAFRLPSGIPPTEVETWGWGGFAMTYYPNGDPSGANDGYPGSLFGTGHAWRHQVSEISIPVPVISTAKNLSQLNTAGTLQAFTDIFAVSNVEMPRAGLSYLPKQGSQTTGKLYFCWGGHLADPGDLTHGWCEVNLSNPQIKRAWYLDVPHHEFNTNDYLLEIPSAWAAANTPGKLLGTGRFRDGGWSGQGPALFAIGPWNQGNPPANGTSLQYKTLLRYTSTEDPESWEEETNHTMSDYHDSDEWSGAAWITAGNKEAVVFVGTKGTGDCWYGFSDGTVWEPPYPEDPEGERGWWSTGFVGRFIFYDPADLAKVAAGTMESWEPQPYAYLDVDQYLYHISSSQLWYHLGAACFDSTHGLFYVFEPYVDDDAPIVHVWQVSGGGSTETAVISLDRTQLSFGGTVSGGHTDSQTFAIENSGTGTMNWSVSDNAAWLSCSPASGSDAGVVTVSVAVSGLSAGSYSGTITVSSSEASNSPQTVSVTLQVYGSGDSSGPFGQYATPDNGAVVSSSVPFTGWALDDIGVESVKLYRGSGGSRIYIGDAVFVAGARPDVEAAYPGYPMNYRAGWGYMMLTNFLPDGGNGTFTIYAIAQDVEGNEVSLGSRTITCDNANAVKPFGAIDTPLQGGTANGASFRNHGWVLTPLPNAVPTDGSTIGVVVDGVSLGHPVYNIYRSDIASLFPGYANSDGAAAYFDIDTTAYTNGVHTIAWSAVDDAGNTDGIGSRYFTIQNSGSSRAASAWLPDSFRDIVDSPGDEVISFKIRELQRIQIPLTEQGECAGFMLVGDQLRPLPIGSTLDRERGIFYWLPGPGFVGRYEFLFLCRENKETMKKRVTIIVTPRFEVNTDENKE